MRPLKFCFSLLLFIAPFFLTAQHSQADSVLLSRGELVIEFELPFSVSVNEISRIVSVDNFNGRVARAYTNRKQFEEFVTLGIPYRVVIPELRDEQYTALHYESMIAGNWDSYPTYPAYDSLMHRFGQLFPALCRIDTIGVTTAGRLLLAVVLHGNSGGRPVPQMLYTSSMHGDETTGYILLLRLTDYLLSNYGTNARITRLLDSLEIWINPLANPDGTYKGGNNTLTGAIRGNHNFVDLNRNFPDPEDGQHPDQNPWQAETMAFMMLAAEQHFVMSANFHGGAEVVNYPWDTWSRLPADHQWWLLVSHEYADTAQYYSPPGYFDDFSTGVVNGYTWYSISGGRQDYMNYFHQCREVTLEISSSKMPPALQLPAYWNYNYRSLLNYLEQGLYGLSGIISDSLTGLPVRARVIISGHDQDSSHVYSRASDGYYKRLLYNGTWNVSYSATGYHTQTFPLSVQNSQGTYQNVALVPTGTSDEARKGKELQVYPNPVRDVLTVNIPENMKTVKLEVFSVDGQQLMNKYFVQGESIHISTTTLKPGLYIVMISSSDAGFRSVFIKE